MSCLYDEANSLALTLFSSSLLTVSIYQLQSSRTSTAVFLVYVAFPYLIILNSGLILHSLRHWMTRLSHRQLRLQAWYDAIQLMPSLAAETEILGRFFSSISRIRHVIARRIWNP